MQYYSFRHRNIWNICLFSSIHYLVDTLCNNKEFIPSFKNLTNLGFQQSSCLQTNTINPCLLLFRKSTFNILSPTDLVNSLYCKGKFKRKWGTWAAGLIELEVFTVGYTITTLVRRDTDAWWVAHQSSIGAAPIGWTESSADGYDEEW